MTERIVEIAAAPASLSVRTGNLVIESEGGGSAMVPLVDLGCVMIAHPRVALTHGVVRQVAEAGAMIVACDEKFMPIAMLLPLQSHHLQTERLASQLRARLPLRKRLWQQIVCAKIRSQARTLTEIRGQDFGLAAAVSRVRSGDTTNVEAEMARRYWSVLFAARFVRDRDQPGVNAQLNYGYAVLRAQIARAICASGLHPSVGLHHHNRYNAFCLADDLMEPFRPVVDRIVAMRADVCGMDSELDREAKEALIDAVTGRVTLDGESRTMWDVALRLTTSLHQVFAGERRDLVVAEV